MSGLTINALCAGYGKRRIIEHLSISTLPRGEVTVLLGPNGCGKSTLLRALAGLNRASGEAWLNEENLLSLPFARRAEKVVFLPQSLPQGVHLQVLESVVVAQRASGAGQNQAQAIALLEELGIAHLAMNYLDSLSGGQKQLVGLAQSLIRRPALLLLDEPLSALDLNYQFHVMDVVSRETRRYGYAGRLTRYQYRTAACRPGHHAERGETYRQRRPANGDPCREPCAGIRRTRES